MAATVLGLDIGGANLKAAAADKRAVSVPFPLWREPGGLPAKLAELLAHFPDADEFAVTMTGELCDCYETKRQGVNAILTAVQNVSRSRPIRVWGTGGAFLNVEEARRDYLKVAAANWHALATFAGGFVPGGKSILVDVGTTTSDVIPILDGVPVPKGKTDPDRLSNYELVYSGVRRTPICALLGSDVAAELFATTRDAYLLLGLVPEDATDTDTADGRPATRDHAHARMSRMVCGDAETTWADITQALAGRARDVQIRQLAAACNQAWWRLDTLRPSRVGELAQEVFRRRKQNPDADHGELYEQLRAECRRHRVTYICCGSGEFLAQEARHDTELDEKFLKHVRRLLNGEDTEPDFISLADRLGPAASGCAPAYALAVLGAERRP
jgi:probable H4MPT-linked C1 transfer pathway protein